MSEIQQTRYDQLLRRVADLKGPGSKVSWALGDLMPTIDVENVPAELQLLMGSRLCMGTALLGAGGAGNFSTMLLRNNDGSGMIGRLLGVTVQQAAGTIVIGPTQNSDTLLGGEAFADTRVFGQGTALKLMGSNNNLAQGSTFMTLDANADGYAEFFPPGGLAIIAPGGAFSVGNGTANSTLRCSWMWIERQAQESELNL